MFEIKDVHSGYGKVEVLAGVGLTVEHGSSIGLFGRNGAGKTTLAHTIMGIIRARKGDIRWNGESVVGQRPEQIVKRDISLVPQSRGLFPSLTVNENLVLSCAAWRMPKGEVRDRVEEMYDLFPDLCDRRELFAASLSGGQQQMLAIAKALIRRPKLLILDEPSIGLAPKVLAEIKELVNQLRSDDLTVIIVEQNIKWAWGMVDHGYVLEQGRIVEELRGSVLEAEKAMAQHLGVN